MMSRINPKTYIASVCDIFISLTRKRNHKSELLISDNLSQFFAIVKIKQDSVDAQSKRKNSKMNRVIQINENRRQSRFNGTNLLNLTFNLHHY